MLASRRRAGLKQVELAAALGERYSHSVISEVEHNRFSLRLDGAVRAAEELGVSLDYLVGLTDDSTPAAELSSRLETLSGQRTVEPESPDKVLPFIPADASGSVGGEFDPVRRYECDDIRLAAGSHSFADIELVAGEVRFRRDWLRAHNLRAADLALLDAAGNSMEPTIRDGDSVLVDESRTEPVHGRIFALSTTDGPLVKRLRRRRGRWWADSDHEDHKPRPVFQEDRLLGLVVWWAHTE